MAYLRYIVPALAAVGSAAAATCSVDATTTVQNAGDATGLASCRTFTGSIAIATGTTDNIAFEGIQEITGSLVADSARNLPGISSSTLTTIGDTFSLQNLTAISNLNFQRLSSVGKIDWNGLGPALQALTFTTGVSMAKTLSIQNTFLGALTGINLQTVETVLLANNNYLTSVSMQLGNVSNDLTINSNGRNVSAEFPNLIWANSLTVNNVSTFNIPSLQTVNTSLYLNSDYFTSVSAPNVTSIGNDLSLIDCTQLTNISFPLLTTIGGGVKLASNPALKSINGFPKLSTIGGALDFQGNFTNATLPSLTSIRGAFNMQSQTDIQSTCDKFQSLSGGQSAVIQGNFSCSGNVGTTNSGAASGSGTGTGSGASPTKSGAAQAVTIPALTGVLGVVAAIFGLL